MRSPGSPDARERVRHAEGERLSSPFALRAATTRARARRRHRDRGWTFARIAERCMQRHHGVARGRSYTREQARAFGDVRDIGVPGLAQFILQDRVWIG